MRFGLVNEVVPRAELDAAVERWVDDVLACAPLSVRAIKQVVRRTAHLTAAEAQALRLPALVEALQSRGSATRACAPSSRSASRSGRGADAMPYVITDACIDVKDKACLEACPVDCIYEGGRTLYIQPDECIDCGAVRDRLPGGGDLMPTTACRRSSKPWIAINREFFGPEVTAWARPAARIADTTTNDHPRVAAWPEKAGS